MKNKGVLVIAKEKGSKTAGRQLAAAVISQLATAAASALLAQVDVFEGLHPFGLALMIGVPDSYSISALAGFVISGLFFRASVNTTAYTAAAGVVAALRWILAGMTRGRKYQNSYTACLSAGLLSAGLTEISVMLLTSTATLESASRVVAGLMICGAFSYFYRVTYEALRRADIGNLSAAQRACLALAMCTAIMALYSINIGPLSLGRIAAVAASIFAACCLASPLDAAVFAACSAGIVLSEGSFAFGAAGIAVAGALASLFKRRPRALLSVVFLLSASLFAFCGENYVYSMTYIAEVMVASLVFLIIPRIVPAAVFDGPQDIMQSATSAMAQKIDSISGAMKDVSALLERTSPAKTVRFDTDKLFSNAAEKVCRGCRSMSECWVRDYGGTVEALSKLKTPLLEKGSVHAQDLEPRFKEKCQTPQRLCSEINDEYRQMREETRRSRNTDLYRSMLKKQFSAVSDMLDSARGELLTYKQWDEERSRRILECATRLGLSVETASCVYDADDRPLITVTLKDSPSDMLIKRLRAGAGAIVGTKLSAPVSESSAGGVTLRFNMQPLFTIKTAAAQSAAEGTVCGDVYSIFSDLAGNVHILLSDGMGTGERAAKDGAVCCAFVRRLLEAGFAVKRAAELANAAMALREDSETASTLDVLSVNICDGTARLFKAGAAASYCLHEGVVAKLESRSLPVGILDNVVSREMSLSLSDGDVIVVTSDGAENGGPFVADLLKRLKNESAEVICREIAKRGFSGTRDDVTVIVIKLEKNSHSRLA